MATMTLETLIAQLRASCAGSLRAVVLYGSSAGAATDRHADRNVLVVVSEFRGERAPELGAIMRSWTDGGDPPLLILTDAEWRSSVDVFAIEHADIRARHRVLFQAVDYDVLAVRDPAPTETRQQLEYEAMALLLRQRAAMLQVGRDGGRALSVLLSGHGSALALFRAALRLAGNEPAEDAAALCEQMGRRAGFDAAPFTAVVAQRKADGAVSAASAPGILAAYHEGLQRFVAWVDGLPSA